MHPDHLVLPRSYLFVPGNRPERFAKALASGADAVILDLEDAVGPEEKDCARAHVAAWLASHAGERVHVRINGADTRWFADDVAAFAPCANVDAIVVPKADNKAVFAAVLAGAHPALALLALIESAAGFAAIGAIASAPRIERLVFGTVDFQLDTGINGDGEELAYFRSLMTWASRLAGIGSPVDGVTMELDDPEAVNRAAHRAQRFGFGAKLCIHPKQVAPTHDAFTPGPHERAWATRVLAAANSSGDSVAVVDGKMIDAPVIRRARIILGAVREASSHDAQPSPG